MDLKKIKTKVCPCCNSIAILDSKKNFDLATNDFEEFREFDCGLMLMATLNDDIITLNICKKSKEYLNRMSKRTIALDKLLNLINSLDVDCEFKNNIQTALTFELIK